MKNYYYLLTSLKDLHWDQEKSPYSPEELIERIKEALTPEDFKIIKMFLYRFDNKNLINLIEKKSAYSSLGIFSRDDLEQELKVPVKLPIYMKSFLDNLKLDRGSFAGIMREDQLEIFYYDYLMNCENKFVRDYTTFDFNLRNFLVALNGRKFKLDLSSHVLPINEDSANLVNSQSADFGLSVHYPWVQEVLRIYDEKNILDVEKKLDKLRFDTLGSMVTFDYFNPRAILSYLIRFFIIHRWANIDEKRGTEIFRKITDDLVEGVRL